VGPRLEYTPQAKDLPGFEFARAFNGQGSFTMPCHEHLLLASAKKKQDSVLVALNSISDGAGPVASKKGRKGLQISLMNQGSARKSIHASLVLNETVS
jgi:hypothetical protein